PAHAQVRANVLYCLERPGHGAGGVRAAVGNEAVPCKRCPAQRRPRNVAGNDVFLFFDAVLPSQRGVLAAHAARTDLGLCRLAAPCRPVFRVVFFSPVSPLRLPPGGVCELGLWRTPPGAARFTAFARGSEMAGPPRLSELSRAPGCHVANV